MSINSNNNILNEILSTIDDLPANKEEQEKTLNITKNGTTEVTADEEGMTLSRVTVNVEVESGGAEELENLIDQSDVLDSTEGTIEEKVEYLILQMRTVLEMKSVSFGVNSSKTARVDLNCKGINSLYRAFHNCVSLKEVHLTNTQKVSDWRQAFDDNQLITIETLDMSGADKDIIGKLNYYWIRTPTLQNLKIVSETIKNSITFVWCTKLTAESVQSIFDGLNSNVTGMTLTLPSVFENAETEAVVNANIEEVDGVKRVKGKEGWSLVR